MPEHQQSHAASSGLSLQSELHSCTCTLRCSLVCQLSAQTLAGPDITAGGPLVACAHSCHKLPQLIASFSKSVTLLLVLPMHPRQHRSPAARCLYINFSGCMSGAHLLSKSAVQLTCNMVIAVSSSWHTNNDQNWQGVVLAQQKHRARRHTSLMHCWFVLAHTAAPELAAGNLVGETCQLVDKTLDHLQHEKPPW